MLTKLLMRVHLDKIPIFLFAWPNYYERNHVMNRLPLVSVIATVVIIHGAICMADSTSTSIQRIQTSQAPEPIGPYSQAIQVLTPRLLFISGQIPLDPATGVLYTDLIAATEQVMKNLRAVLQAANMNFSNVVKTTIYLTNMNDFAVVNKVYQTYLHDVQHFPARETIQVAALPKGSCVEISMVAAQ